MLLVIIDTPKALLMKKIFIILTLCVLCSCAKTSQEPEYYNPVEGCWVLTNIIDERDHPQPGLEIHKYTHDFEYYTYLLPDSDNPVVSATYTIDKNILSVTYPKTQYYYAHIRTYRYTIANNTLNVYWDHLDAVDNTFLGTTVYVYERYDYP